MKNNNENIIGFDFQGWPITKLSVREILERLGAKLNDTTGIYEIENTQALNLYPRVLGDDGMAYGIEKGFITEFEISPNNDYCNVFVDKKDENIDVYLEDETVPGMFINNNNHDKYFLMAYDKKRELYRLKRFCGDNTCIYVEKETLKKWIEETQNNHDEQGIDNTPT